MVDRAAVQDALVAEVQAEEVQVVVLLQAVQVEEVQSVAEVVLVGGSQQRRVDALDGQMDLRGLVVAKHHDDQSAAQVQAWSRSTQVAGPLPREQNVPQVHNQGLAMLLEPRSVASSVALAARDVAWDSYHAVAEEEFLAVVEILEPRACLSLGSRCAPWFFCHVSCDECDVLAFDCAIVNAMLN